MTGNKSPKASEKERSPYLYAFEGVDGVGKTSVATLVQQSLSHILKIHRHQEPSNNVKELLEKEPKSWLSRLYLMLRDRETVSIPTMKRLLEMESFHTCPIVFADRCFLSSCVYQSAESNGVISPMEILQLHKETNCFFPPRMVFVIHADIKQIQQRLWERERAMQGELSFDTFEKYCKETMPYWEKAAKMQAMYLQLQGDFAGRADWGTRIIAVENDSLEEAVEKIAVMIMLDLLK